jgi:hypothetical protein
VLVAMLICLAAGGALLIPALVWLYAIDETGDGRLDRSEQGYVARNGDSEDSARSTSLSTSANAGPRHTCKASASRDDSSAGDPEADLTNSSKRSTSRSPGPTTRR